MTSEDALIVLKGIGKTFPGVRALDDVSFAVKRGAVHGLVGENGAGKSTLINILGGIYPTHDGTILLDGEEFSPQVPAEAQLSGVSVVHQEIRLAETLTVAENMFLGRQIRKHGFIDWKAMKVAAQDMISQLGLRIDPGEIVGNLTVAQQQIVEICKAINMKTKLLIMDEPSSTLTDRELDVLFQIIDRLQEQGTSILYVSHKLEEIFQICSDVTVLRDGQHIATMPVVDVPKQKLINLMVGREMGKQFPKEDVEIGEEVLRVEGLSREGVFNDVSFTLHRGEILGIAGLVGSGRTEVVRGLLGIDKISSGRIWHNGQEIQIRSIRDAIDRGFGLIPEDRKRQGLVQIFSVKFNTSLVNWRKVFKKGILRDRLEEEYARYEIKRLQISTPSTDAVVENLSGGNQQKVVIGKWLLAESDIIIMDEPTRGIDVGAKFEIYKLMTELVKQGKSIIMISSELPEIIGMSDRVIIMHEGELAGELPRDELTQESIMSIAFSAA